MDFRNINLRTTEDLIDLQQKISEATTQKQAESQLPSAVYEELLENMNKANISFEKACQNLKTYLSSIKSIKLYLAEEPSAQFENRILEMFDDTKNFVIDFVIDRSIIGGVKVVIDGKYFDESLQHKVEEVLKNNLK